MKIKYLLTPDAAPSAALPVASTLPAPVSPSPAPVAVAALAAPAAPSAAPSAPAVPALAAMPTSEAEMVAFAASSLRTPDPAVPAPPAAPSGQSDDLDAPIAPEVLATLGEAGQRALQTERQKRKEARNENAELKARLAELEAKTATLPPAPSAPEGVPPVPDPAAAVPAPSAPPVAPVVTALTECKTSADVDALVIRASREQSLAMQLNTLLNTAGVAAVVQRLQQSKLDNFRGVPLDQLTPEFLAGELAQTYQQAEEIKLTAPQQKQAIDTTRTSMLQAVTILPGLKDSNGALRKEFNALANNPAVRALGPQWPEYVAQTLLGRQALAKASAPAPTAPAPLPATPVPTPAPSPAAPRVSVPPAVPPSPTDEIAARLTTGNVTEKDMAKLAAASLRGGK